ncbi:MAG: hypothetical protein IKT98_08555 [Selenomonadaceae bacterium]|nr:hypothetical protein [Selenomonadaceae bacterium]
MNQRGFATLEVILMVMVIGILASVAVPRFTSVTAAANSAKIQADLSTIDAAIAVYYMEGGKADGLSKIADLNGYLNDAAKIKPPTGKAYVKGTDETITELTIPSDYEFNTDKTRAVLKIDSTEYTAGDFTTKKSTT